MSHCVKLLCVKLSYGLESSVAVTYFLRQIYKILNYFIPHSQMFTVNSFPILQVIVNLLQCNSTILG